MPTWGEQVNIFNPLNQFYDIARSSPLLQTYVEPLSQLLRIVKTDEFSVRREGSRIVMARRFGSGDARDYLSIIERLAAGEPWEKIVSGIDAQLVKTERKELGEDQPIEIDKRLLNFIQKDNPLAVGFSMDANMLLSFPELMLSRLRSITVPDQTPNREVVETVKAFGDYVYNVYIKEGNYIDRDIVGYITDDDLLTFAKDIILLTLRPDLATQANRDRARQVWSKLKTVPRIQKFSGNVDDLFRSYQASLGGETAATGLEAAAQNLTDPAAKGLDQAAKNLEDRCGTGYAPSLFPFAFGAGSGHEEDNDRHEHNRNNSQEIDDAKGHSSFILRANPMASDQQTRVASIPNDTTSQYGLSTSERNGEMTSAPNITWPALSKMLDSRSSWPVVNTGSRKIYNTPNDSITSHDSTENGWSSTGFGIPFVRQAYAADPSTGFAGPGQTGGAGCAIARVVAPVLRSAASLTGTTLWQMPNRWLLRKTGSLVNQSLPTIDYLSQPRPTPTPTPSSIHPFPITSYNQLKSITWYDFGANFPTQNLTPDIIKKMNTLGFNSVWLVNPWYTYNPTRGKYNEAAFAQLLSTLKSLQQNNMRAIINLNYLGPGWSPTGIDPCKYTSDPNMYQQFVSYATEFLKRIEPYNDSVYIMVTNEPQYSCSIDDKISAITSFPQALGNFPNQLPPSLREKFVIGFHDYDPPLTVKDYPQTYQTFDFTSTVAYGLESKTDPQIRSQLDQLTLAIKSSSDIPVVIGELGANSCNGQEANQTRVLKTAASWAEGHGIGFNVWGWKPGPIDQECTNPVFGGYSITNPDGSLKPSAEALQQLLFYGPDYPLRR